MDIEKINLPKIKDNDLVVVSIYEYACLFYSDGRVAKTDLVINDLEARLGKVEVPENVKEEARKSAFDEYGRFFSGKMIEDLAAGRIRYAAEWYKQSHLIDKAVSEGYLKEVVDVFGMNDQLKRLILYSHNIPILIFGVRGDVLNLKLQAHNWEFNGINCEDILLNLSTIKPEYVDVSIYQFRGISVGPDGIKKAMRATPGGTTLANYLIKNGVLPE